MGCHAVHSLLGGCHADVYLISEFLSLAVRAGKHACSTIFLIISFSSKQTLDAQSRPVCANVDDWRHDARHFDDSSLHISTDALLTLGFRLNTPTVLDNIIS